MATKSNNQTTDIIKAVTIFFMVLFALFFIIRWLVRRPKVKKLKPLVSELLWGDWRNLTPEDLSYISTNFKLLKKGERELVLNKLENISYVING